MAALYSMMGTVGLVGIASLYMKVSQQVRAVLMKDASLICIGIPYGLFVVPHNEQQVFATQPTFFSAC